MTPCNPVIRNYGTFEHAVHNRRTKHSHARTKLRCIVLAIPNPQMRPMLFAD